MFKKHPVFEVLCAPVSKTMEFFKRVTSKKKTARQVHEYQSEIMRKKYGQ